MDNSVGFLIGRFAFEPTGTHLCIYESGIQPDHAVLRKVTLTEWKNVKSGYVVDIKPLIEGIVEHKAGWALL